TIPVTPGKSMWLLYPSWVPGIHEPYSPIKEVSGLVIKAGGKVIPWARDEYNVRAFKVDVPAGVSTLDVNFKFLSPQKHGQGRIIMTPEMLDMSWYKVSMYPAGYYVRDIKTVASVTLPEGWKF